jgi:molybdopterin synthase catalytic subunit
VIIEITPNEFNPWQYLQNQELQAGKYGAMTNFIGTMRDYNIGDVVKSMFLEHYPNMTEKYLQQISDTALQRWDILDTLIVHRVGEILPGDTIVLVATWAGHRAPAFDACRFLIEELKAKAPFWKQETLADNDVRWVDTTKIHC